MASFYGSACLLYSVLLQDHMAWSASNVEEGVAGSELPSEAAGGLENVS